MFLASRCVFLFYLTLLTFMLTHPSYASGNISFVRDPHSCARPEEALIRHMDLQLDIDFSKKIIRGIATFRIQCETGANTLWLDTRGLDIQQVSLDGGIKTEFHLHPDVPYLGRPLSVMIRPDTREVTVVYQTSNEPGALQWLSPEQTGGGKLPFLFTQGQAILSRTWFPVQDSPGIRFSWTASVKVPAEFMVVMSGNNPRERSLDGLYSFRMDLPVPAYLVALSAGDFEFRPLGERCGVYAEPSMIDKAAYELADTEKMLEAAEKLYGTYQWGRYDLIVLPPSFPFGGMENPKLTFATPTIIAGDRSLTSLVAHELAHSWSGNLVTNATWNDFWLNEGFTVYFERRIMEALYGKAYADMLALLGYQDLQKTLDDLGKNSKDTHLKLDLAGRDPDDGMNDVAYEKGYFFLLAIESVAGRPAFDAFLIRYFKEFAFKSLDTESFLKYLFLKLNALNKAKFDAVRWVYQPGLPDDTQAPVSERFNQVNAQLLELLSGKTSPEDLSTDSWTTHEWLQLIRQLPDTLPPATATRYDKVFGFSKSGNAEIQAAWFEKMIPTAYTGIDESLESFLLRVGRRKFVLPLFRAMLRNPNRAAKAREIYVRARPGYHAVTAGSLDEVFQKGQ
jgi:leukotriene-A4 hydrolase